MTEAQTQRPLFRARENRQSTFYNLSFLQSYVQLWVLTCYEGIISIWAIRAVVIRVTDIHFVEKKPLAISEINVKLPPFKSGEHNPASASTIDHVPFTVEYLTFIQI